jgi:hypothetical protein
MPLMTIFEPLFLLLALATIVALISAAVVAVRGQRSRSLAILRRLGVGAATYYAVVLMVAYFSVPPLHRVGEPVCFDDWCIGVVEAQHEPAGSSSRWHVTLRIASRARRVNQRENYAAVFLTDSRGRKYFPDPAPANIPLDSRLGPAESLDAPRTFTLPLDATGVRLVFTHEGGFPIGALIIGENEFFHDATVVKLD